KPLQKPPPPTSPSPIPGRRRASNGHHSAEPRTETPRMIRATPGNPSTGASTDPRPFVGQRLCQVILPAGQPDPFSEVESLRRLLIAEAAELTAELGCPVEFGSE